MIRRSTNQFDFTLLLYVVRACNLYGNCRLLDLLVLQSEAGKNRERDTHTDAVQSIMRPPTWRPHYALLRNAMQR